MAGGDENATTPDHPEPSGVTVGDLGERALISLFTSAATTATSGDIVVGSGDDAAVFDAGGPTVISTDTAVQNRHFRFEWSTPRQIGERAVIQSATDIAAMGARTVGVVVSIACPVSTPAATLTEINDGILAATHRLGGRVLGGDLVAADEVVLTVTSVGALDGLTPVALTGAQVGDVLAVSGPLGSAAAGLAVLLAADGCDEDGERSAERSHRLRAQHAEVVDSHRLPNPDLSAGVVAARAGAHAMTDVSDGLVEELKTLAAASNVALAVDVSRVPRTEATRRAAAELGESDDIWALTGGEDHQLLAAFAAADVPLGWVVIGDVRERTGDRAPVSLDGIATSDLRGWQSFGHQ
ncbi:thiamine-phosphate kinase [Gordonia sputi]|uniref:Thiamine-monophosphate kinase n=1 Tax=Gordonia sputi NBRC 100414 TaxID=1089453 RepID=H5TZI3_9ACTN|nr:thiamine-phosphate kinase [Gordonia sputi]NKY93708.1 thiamine-phosphate kinase [Gordonia sputi]GAB38891.1 thiamine-monophosphate kinase [Gordonia sputi NBRC 100414]